MFEVSYMVALMTLCFGGILVGAITLIILIATMAQDRKTIQYIREAEAELKRSTEERYGSPE